MKNKFSFQTNRLASNKLFMRHFLQIFLAMTVIFMLFALYTYRSSRKIIEKEFINSGAQALENMSEYVDSYILDTKYMISTLVVNETMHFFYASPSPESIWSDYSTQVQSQLTVLRYSREAIQGIYLYSQASNTIYSSSTHSNRNTFDDRFWLDHLNADESGFSIFPYAMRNSFPHVICVAKEFTVDGNHCAIAIMVDLSKLSLLSSINANSYQNAFLVSDNNEIIYRYKQDSFLEPLDTVEYLTHYESGIAEKTFISSGSPDTYSYMQQHSSNFPWSYVLVTHLQNYTSRLSSQNALLFGACGALIVFAVLFAVFFALRSLKPIQNIRNFLDSPEMLSSNKISDNEDIKYISRRITQFIQTNQALKDELQERMDSLNESQLLALQSQINPHFLSNTLNLMYIQATDSLGFDHPLPQMILNTSSLIRYAIEPSKMVTLQTELAQTDIYLSILDERYGRNLKVIHEPDPETLTAKVPRLFIQPIIENAVFHGFAGRDDSECMLTIRCRKNKLPDDPFNDFIMVQIEDNGKGIDEKTLKELKKSLNPEVDTPAKSIGLRNVVQRMNLIYSDRFSLEIESVPGEGTCFTLLFPFVE